MEKKRTNVVYVNPNFKAGISNGVILSDGMYINPNFKGNISAANFDLFPYNATAAPATHNIHVNPRLLQISSANVVASHNAHLLHNSTIENNSAYIVNSRNKIVKTVATTIAPVQQIKTTIPISQVIKKPSYSLVRKDTLSKSITNKPLSVTLKTSTPIPSSKKFNKTNKITDSSNNVWKRKIDFPRIKYSLIKRKSLLLSGPLKQKHSLDKYKLQKHKLRRKSSVSLNSTLSTTNKSIRNKTSLLESSCKSVYIGGEKFLINNNVLHKVTKPKSNDSIRSKSVKKINLCGITYIRKSENVFVMDQRRKNSISKLRKINITCPIFRRLGFCKRHDVGKCPLVHDPKNISICSKFLKGVCKVDGCHLSHQVVLEKMPTCKFFLEGCCMKENCPYLHVKLNQSAKICLAFLNGFCEASVSCVNKHINVCPNFYKYSKCDKVKCTYPHKMPRKIKEPKLPIESQISLPARKSKQSVAQDSNVKTEPKALRYFEDKDKCEDLNSTDGDEGVLYKGRPALGDLPSFISLS